jgi:hypothetical protein
MNVINRRVVSFAALILVAVGLAACGDSEPDQRKAFIAFLEEINHRAGVHFLNPKPEEIKAFGGYLAHYKVITDFNSDFGVIVVEHEARMKKLGVGPGNQAHTLADMIERRPSYPAVKDATVQFMQAIAARVGKANAERSALKQPDDLKAVYTRVFDKLITAPTQAMANSDKVLLEFTDSSARVVDYINDHRGKLTVSGAQVQTNDPRIRAELGALFAAQQEVMKRFQEAQREGQRLLQGS